MSTSRLVLATAFLILGVALAVPVAGQGPPTCPPGWLNPCCAISSWGGAPYASITGALYTNTPPVITNGTVWVYGVCTEAEVVINERFNNMGLIGNATGTPATLQGVTPGGNASTIYGKRITGRGFTITPASATGAQYKVEVMRGCNALIDRCTIDGFAGEGIGVVQQAFARIVNNTLQNNGGEGILPMKPLWCGSAS